MTGHLLGAAGAVEAVAVVQVMISSFLYLAGFSFWVSQILISHPHKMLIMAFDDNSRTIISKQY